MDINVSNAVQLFFPNPSLESVYFEAIANSLDAGATHIDIKVFLESFTNPESLAIDVRDDGEGFNERNFAKFSTLLEKEEDEHKGVGRLVFLNYFSRVNIDSVFQNQRRAFVFSDNFKGESQLEPASEQNSTILQFSGYRKEKIKSYDYVVPDTLKRSIFRHFYPHLYQKKLDGKAISINITLETENPNPHYNFVNSSVQLSTDELPDLKERKFDSSPVDMFADFRILYSVKRTSDSPAIVTSICADGRTIPVDIISKNALPELTEAVFLLFSDMFTGKTNTSRDELELDETSERLVRKFFKDKVAEIIVEELPEVQRMNEEVHQSLSARYPHLLGYFDMRTVGIVDRERTLDEAQKEFFRAQKEILEASSLNDQQFEQSLELSSRLLTEYVLYRTFIIDRLKQTSPADSEADIHNVIAPMQSKLRRSTFIDDVFNNNAWILDDKFMSYSVIMSDRAMAEIYDEISIEDHRDSNANARPDLAIIFSDNPNSAPAVDVVIVELKKHDVQLANKEEVVSQLRQRARRLLEHYPEKIQRIWFYGITDFDDEFRRSLMEDDFIRLFSHGDLFYKEQKIILNMESDVSFPIGLFILSYNALLRDAESRNETFLRILREGLQHTIDNRQSPQTDRKTISA